MPTEEARRESRLRQLARRRGYRVIKSRIRNINIDNLGGYMLVDEYINGVVAGSRFELDLDDIEDFFAD